MISKEIKRAILLEGTVSVPLAVRPVQVQSWIHTIAGRMGIRVSTIKAMLEGRTVIRIRQNQSSDRVPVARLRRQEAKRMELEEAAPVSWAWRNPRTPA